MTNLTEAVPAPPGLAPPASSLPVDAVQDLISRKRDAERNKFRYHLTEADCNLLCTHGTIETFKAGEVLVEGGASVTKVYRIRSGKVGMFKEETQIKELTRGYFIGETLFVRSNMKSILGCAVIAVTDVEVNVINLPFVKQLISVDKILAFKVYRHLASKLSAFLFMSLSHITENPDLQYHVLSRYLNSSTGDLSSEGSDTGSVTDEITIVASSSSTSSSDSSSNNTASTSDLGTQIFLQIKDNIKLANTPPRKKRTKVRGSSAPFRSFSLESPHGQCLLYPERIKFTHIMRQRKISYNDILDITKVGATSLTIIYKIQARTIFFKTEEDMNEFMGLVKSLRISNIRPTNPLSPASPASLSSPLSPVSPASPLAMSYDDVCMSDSDKQFLHNLSVVQTLKKGDIIVAEGDLYQRIYTVISGQISSEKNGRMLMNIDAGETFGVLSLFHLRPSMVNLVVTSDTATVLIIPGYRILELVNTNFSLAVKMYKKAAQVIYSQVHVMMGGGDAPPPIKEGVNRALV